MTYVPVVPPPHSGPPSPRTRELAGLLSKVLEEYAKAHPETTGSEVRAAMRLAARGSPPDASGARAVIALTLGLLIFGLGLGLFLFQRGGGGGTDESLPMIAVALVIFISLLAMVVMKRLR